MLADRLRLSEKQLALLVASADNYICWVDKKTGREIQQPKPVLRSVHDRVGKLLSRIETPDFLHSAIKGRSYISNATTHCPALPSVKVDIKKFYPSTRAHAVYHFFLDRMQCAGDVAGMLAAMLTVEGHLATGSSASPILSFFAYEDMFGEIAELAEVRGCAMTCYVDDMVFTGKGATPRLLFEIRNIAKPYRLWTHKAFAFGPGQPKVITGLAVTLGGPRLPNDRKAVIHESLQGYRQDPEGTATSTLRSLVGRLHEAAQVDPSWRPRAVWAAAELRARERASVSPPAGQTDIDSQAHSPGHGSMIS
uniref:RNA-directed DNA polymerase n=1 Tax=Caulobacter sp. (strain K31) TaxID=366602 RepID=B0SYD3_CAUSK